MATLLTRDGVRLRAIHEPPRTDRITVTPGLAFVVGHGFTGSLDRPALRDVVSGLRSYGGVIAFDFRGHGHSTGVTTVGDREIDDVATAVAWARALGYARVATVGFSMGGGIAIRHAALRDGVDAVVAVSAPGWWYFRGTPAMRRVHWLIETRSGRFAARLARRTRVDPDGWATTPREPYEVVGQIAPTPLLVVHGAADPFLPVAHARALYDRAGEPRELWVRAEVGHAEGAIDPLLLAEIGAWVCASVAPARSEGEGEGDGKGEGEGKDEGADEDEFGRSG